MPEVTLRDITDDNWTQAIYAGDAVAGQPGVRNVVFPLIPPEGCHGH